MALDSEEIRKRQQRRAQMQAKRRAERRKVFISLAAAGVVLAAAAAVILLTGRGSSGKEPADATQPSQQVQTQPQTEPPTQAPAGAAEQSASTVIRLAAVGDVNATDKVVASGSMNGGYDYTGMLMDAAPLLADADLTVMNFEGILSGSPYGSTNHNSAPQELMQALRSAGVDVVQLANSCSINNGLLGLASTISGVQNAGMEAVGTFASAEAFRKSKGFTLMEVQGVKIAFVAFTKGMDGMGLPVGSEDCVNLLYTDYASSYQTVDRSGITSLLSDVAKEQPDVTVALLHWGSEYNDQISSSQETIRSLMLANGVDVIIGTHSHYVQQIEMDPEAGTLVAYSLGDFLGDGERAGTNYSVVLNVEITKDNTTGETKVTDYTYTPIYQLTDGETLRVVRIREAMHAYETGYVDAVSKEVYDSMAYALERIEDRIRPDASE